ncbi:Hypothetical protein DHA2_151320 [Giardia duodenalis]|uniref:Uncharacterized protein n=1 Tax=Giardia intestinalis TaxID=5741 RepID=V6TM94_GIAIN|nr:Hypothetical protein DHA2_151320 [Giardia intestinalis]
MRAINTSSLGFNQHMDAAEGITWKPPVYAFKRKSDEHKGLGSSLFHSTKPNGNIPKVKNASKTVNGIRRGEALASTNQHTVSPYRPGSPERATAKFMKPHGTHLFSEGGNHVDIPTAIYIDSFSEVPVDPPAKPVDTAKKAVPLYLQRVASPQIYTGEKFSPRLQGSPQPYPKLEGAPTKCIKTRHDKHDNFMFSSPTQDELREHDIEMHAVEAIESALHIISLSNQPLHHSLQNESSNFLEHQRPEWLPSKSNSFTNNASPVSDVGISSSDTLSYPFMESFEEVVDQPSINPIEMVNKTMQTYPPQDLTKPRYALLTTSSQMQHTHSHISYTTPQPPLASGEFTDAETNTFKGVAINSPTLGSIEHNPCSIFSTRSTQTEVDKRKQDDQFTTEHTIESKDWSNSNFSSKHPVSAESTNNSASSHTDIPAVDENAEPEEKMSSFWEDLPGLTTYTIDSPLQQSAHTFSLSADEDRNGIGTNLNKPSYCAIDSSSTLTAKKDLTDRPYKIEQQKPAAHIRAASEGISLPPPCSILGKIKPCDNEEKSCDPSDSISENSKEVFCNDVALSNGIESEVCHSSWEENSEENPYLAVGKAYRDEEHHRDPLPDRPRERPYLAVGEAYRDEEHHRDPLPDRPRERPYLAVGEAYRDEEHHLIHNPNGKRAKNPYWGIGAAFWSEPYHIQARIEYIELRQQESITHRLK